MVNAVKKKKIILMGRKYKQAVRTTDHETVGLARRRVYPQTKQR